MAKHLNAGTLRRRDQAKSALPGGVAPLSTGSLHRPLYRGEVVWNKTEARSGRKTAATSRPEEVAARLEPARALRVSRMRRGRRRTNASQPRARPRTWIDDPGAAATPS